MGQLVVVLGLALTKIECGAKVVQECVVVRMSSEVGVGAIDQIR